MLRRILFATVLITTFASSSYATSLTLTNKAKPGVGTNWVLVMQGGFQHNLGACDDPCKVTVDATMAQQTIDGVEYELGGKQPEKYLDCSKPKVYGPLQGKSTTVTIDSNLGTCAIKQ